MVNTNNSYEQCMQLLIKNHYAHYSIAYILKQKEESKTKYYALAYDKQEQENIISLTIEVDGSYYINSVPDWDFNVDGYLLEDLENGYEIDYMPLEEHYNYWYAINEWRDEIDHQDGLQKYLSYCHMNGISEHEIGLLQFEYVNIMDLYQEKNAGYTIIAEMKCGEKAIVLAERKSDIAQYVTWRTNVYRKRGFDLGHYFSDFKSAYQDFEKRSHDMMDDELSLTKNKCRPKKKVHER